MAALVEEDSREDGPPGNNADKEECSDSSRRDILPSPESGLEAFGSGSPLGDIPAASTAADSCKDSCRSVAIGDDDRLELGRPP